MLEIAFRPLQLSDKQAVDTLLKGSAAPMCDHTFTNLYAWQQLYHTSWAEVCGQLVVRFTLPESDENGYMICDGGCVERVFDSLKLHTQSVGERLRLVCADAATVERFKVWAAESYSDDDARGEECFAFCNNPDYRDYIYSVEELATLAGSKFKPKRNHVNRFESLYKWSVVPLTEEYFKACLQLECRWQRRKADDTGEVGEFDCRESDEQQAIRRTLDAYKELGIEGLVLLVDGNVAAFTYGSKINDEIFCTHTEKADSAYEGVFPMINRLFARYLLERGYRYVNREEDMGLAGLRRAKQSYNPVRQQERMGVVSLTQRERECRDLWQRTFGDSREFVDMFFTDVYRPENLFCRKEQGRVVSMAYVVELQTDYGPTGYLYAVATDADFRMRGLSSAVVEEALAEMRRRGYCAAMLIPSQSSLKHFYARFGFVDADYALDFSDGFDFGTGNPAFDRAMVLELK